MRTVLRNATWDRLARLRRQRQFRTFGTLGLVILGPVLALMTIAFLGPLDAVTSVAGLRFVLLADLVYVLVVATLVLRQVAQMVAARRRHSAGSRLHLRLTGVFALIALIPTVLVAVFAFITINTGLEGWFSDRVSRVVGSSLSAAQAYQSEHVEDLQEDAAALANYLNTAQRNAFLLDDGKIRQLLTQGQGLVQRGLKEAYVINGAGEIQSRGERSYLFDFEQPGRRALARAQAGELVILQDWAVNEFRALLRLEAFEDKYLYVSRSVDGALLSLLDQTQDTAQFYQQLENERGRILFEFGLLYLGFAVILILAAIWLGLWFAERLARPVGRLAGAAQRVGGGDLDVQVREERGDDEIAMLGRLFNQMTRQLKVQRDTLLESTHQIEQRRRLFDSVLGSVTAGVVGLDAQGHIDFLNKSAQRLVSIEESEAHNLRLADAIPEFSDLFARLTDGAGETVQQEIKLSRNGKLESLLVRMSTRRNTEGQPEGYVVAFDDVTELVSAQRMAAWGDVARRIAHEIKNPLTPIRLSAERVNRKFGKQLDADSARDLAQYTDVIIRQTNDLRRIVDEFSKFARMPGPDLRREDLTRLLQEAVLLQETGQPDIRFGSDIAAGPVYGDLDSTMISQALTNLIKNAGEAIESKIENGVEDGFAPEIRVGLSHHGATAEIRIADNGIGLPADRARLFEPYVTNRANGTGLGLPIVKKIIEEHGGTLVLTDAPVFDANTGAGALAIIRLPVEDDTALVPDMPQVAE